MISAVVVSCNEGHLLDACLDSIAFCEEIIVVDLESTDNTKEVAQKYNAVYIYHKKVAVVEIIHAWIQEKTKYDWILIIDPDEACSNDLQLDVLKLLPSISDNTGSIIVPCRYYFGKRLLRGTHWGGINERIFIVNKKRFNFTSAVHRGRQLKQGFIPYYIKYSGSNFIHHYWMQNFSEFINKHRRYLKEEGKARYLNGVRCSFKQLLRTPFREFYSSFFVNKGYKDGYLGLCLGFFWAWYNTMAQLRLYNYIKNQ